MFSQDKNDTIVHPLGKLFASNFKKHGVIHAPFHFSL
jgi:hypothetical protein